MAESAPGPRLIAVDPGYAMSAIVEYFPDSNGVGHAEILANAGLLDMLEHFGATRSDRLIVETIEGYGMPVGIEVLDTCVWIGRFIQAWPGAYSRVTRRSVKLHLCGNSRAKDGNVRQCLIDRFGPGKDKVIGLKKSPGPLYGFKSHMWSALAVAITYAETANENH